MATVNQNTRLKETAPAGADASASDPPSQLFRQEAIEHAAHAMRLSHEPVLLVTPPLTRILALILCGLVALLVVFACLVEVPETEEVGGWAIPSGGMTRVVASRAGRVAVMQVSDGAMARRDQPLLILRSAEWTGVGDANELRITSIQSELAAHKATARAALESIDVRTGQLKLQQKLLLEKADNLERRINVARRQLEIAESTVSRLEPLAKAGYITALMLDTSRSNALLAASRVEELAAQKLDLEGQVGDVQTQVRQQSSERSKIMAGLAVDDASLSQRRVDAEAQRGLVITSPAAGHVTLNVRVGDPVAPGQTLAIIAPSEDHLVAELYVPSRATGSLRQGQPVTVKFDPFPVEKYGGLKGAVREISPALLLPEELRGAGPQIREPAFRVIADLAPNPLLQKVRPGALLKASIVVRRRRLITWLLRPVQGSKS